MHSVNLAWTTPTARITGEPLTLAEITSAQVRRNKVVIATLTPVAATMTYTDTAPAPGGDQYTVDTVTTDSQVSNDSDIATVIVPVPGPAAAITDLVASLV
jgi:hypothetical protein